MILLKFVISLLVISNFAQSSVIRNDNAPAESLYDNNDKVFVLTNDNFYESIFDQPHASNVEFYNSFCGFCRNFAPIYKKFADDIYGWRDIIHVSAIDCANDANNDICRDMEIMKYPTLRYFPPFYRNETSHLGIEIDHPPMQVGEVHLFELMANTTTAPSNWPNLKPITTKSIDLLFQTMPRHMEHIFLVYEPNNQSVIAQKVALDLHKYPEIQVRQVASISVATSLGMNIQSTVYAGTKSTKTLERLPIGKELNRRTAREAIEHYLVAKGIRKIHADDQIQFPPEISSTSQSSVTVVSEVALNEHEAAIIEHVKANRGVAFQSDIEGAIRYSLVHELVKYNRMNEEQITAIRRYVSVLQK